MLPEMVHVRLWTRGSGLQTAVWYLPGALPAPHWGHPCASNESGQGAGGSQFQQQGAEGQGCERSFAGTGGNSCLMAAGWLGWNWFPVLSAGCFCCGVCPSCHESGCGVCLGTHAPPKVFPTVSFASMWQCITSSLPQRGAPGFLQAAGIPPLCSVPDAGACAGSVPWLFPVRGAMWQ